MSLPGKSMALGDKFLARLRRTLSTRICSARGDVAGNLAPAIGGLLVGCCLGT